MKIKSMLATLGFALILLVVTSPGAFCSDLFYGTIEGADCVVNKLKCAKSVNDPHLAMERDFVLVTGEGSYYFMPNLTRMHKQLAYKKQVRIKGEKKGAAIVVEKFEVLKNNKYKCSWDQIAERETINDR